ncbi:beta-1,3-galactosyl-O-glycosyl-glycoprotein beta-1,6-N-acetylglucosaminyltransferase-like isoform X2 [Littorina saxatilis]|uniref:beta-1,3-galactosyl-O-glycosyl-glycoprotein beta-1,6-N-acetylglucosaminyltransferase-like isoform X2 n=1 Tax=Littorina saxatilis TaxID=31220 RepID=UPI0038B4EEFF
MVVRSNQQGESADSTWLYRRILPQRVLTVTFMVVLLGATLLYYTDVALLFRIPTLTLKGQSQQQTSNNLSTHSAADVLQSLPRVSAVNCSLLWTGDKLELQKAQHSQANRTRKAKTTSEYRRATWDCGRYLQNGGFNLSSVSEEELSFPLAFSLLVYRDADQEILCMRHSWRQKVKWRYFINLTGQEFPLKTNKELVRILKAYHGANDVGGIRDPPIFRWRWQRFSPAPYNLTIYKGSVHVAVSREFVDYVLNTRVGKTLLEWERPVMHPDESYFNTLNNNPQLGVPGSATVNHTSNQHAAYFSRLKIWGSEKDKYGGCKGKFVRDICHFGVGDLPLLTKSPQLFANKFSYDHQPLSYDCLEEWYFHKVELEDAGNPPPLNVSLYEQSPMVKYRYTGPVKNSVMN